MNGELINIPQIGAKTGFKVLFDFDNKEIEFDTLQQIPLGWLSRRNRSLHY